MESLGCLSFFKVFFRKMSFLKRDSYPFLKAFLKETIWKYGDKLPFLGGSDPF